MTRCHAPLHGSDSRRERHHAPNQPVDNIQTRRRNQLTAMKYEGRGEEEMEVDDPELDEIIRRDRERTGFTALAESSVEDIGSDDVNSSTVDSTTLQSPFKPGRATLGIIWQSATRQMVHATTADTGYRTVLCVQSLVPGGPADACGRIKIGDKLVSITELNKLKSNLVGVRWAEIKKLLSGAIGSVATLELLRATDLGAKKAFTVRLQRVKKTEEMQVSRTKVVKKSKGPVGARKGLLFKGLHTDESGDDPWGDDSIEEPRQRSLEDPPGGDELDGLALDEEVERINRRLGRLSKLRVGHQLTADEILELKGLEADLKMLLGRVTRYKKASEKAQSDLVAVKDALDVASKALVQLCSFAGSPFETECNCGHKRYKHVHNAQLAKEAAKQAVQAVLAEFGEIREIQLSLQRGGASLVELVKNTEEAQRRMDEMAAERDDIKNNLEQKVEEFKKETERMEKAAADERAAIRKEGDDKVKAIQSEIDEKNKEIAMLEEKMKHVAEDLENAKAAEDSAYAEMLMVKSSMDTMAEQQKVELAAAEKRAKMLIASSMENANSEQSLADRAKELQMKEEMEALVQKEAEMTEKLKVLEERRAVQDAEALKVAQFKRAVMVALSKVDPDQVEAEEARQKEGLVEGVELLSVMHDYIEGQGSEYEEVWLCDVLDYITARFPFLDIVPWRIEVSNGFDEAFGVERSQESAMQDKIKKGTTKKGFFRGWTHKRDDYKGRPLTLDQLKALEAKRRIAELRRIRDERDEGSSGSEGGAQDAGGIEVESDDDEL